MKKLILVLILSFPTWAQIGWKDLGSGSQLKGAAFKAGLYGALVDCPHAGAPYCTTPSGGWGSFGGSFAGKEEYVMAAQSGCAIDKIHNHMTCTGGGHGDYYGNQVYDFDMATGIITRLTDPSQYPTTGFVYPQYTADGNAVASHTGQGLVYMPVEDAVFKMAIGAGPAPGSQEFVWWITNQRTSPTWVAKYANPAALPYIMGSGASGCTPNSQQLGTFIGGGGTGATFSVWINGSGVPTGYGNKDSVGSGYTSLPTSATIATCTGTETVSGGQLAGGVIWTGGGDQGSMWVLDTSTYNPDVPSSESIIGVSLTLNKIYRYTPSLDTGPGGSNPWTTLSTLSGTIPTYGTCRINPAVRPAVLVCVGAQQVGFAAAGIYAAPLSGAGAFQFTNITSQTTGCSNLYSLVDPGFEFDDSTGLFVGFAGTGNSVTLFDYTSLTCVTRQFSGGPTNTVNPIPTGPGYDRALAYFPKLNTFLVAPNALNHMFTLKLHADGQGHSTLTCEDFDGDGYGVGPGCTGPDADDTDPTVNTTATVLAKYGNIQTFLEHMGVQNASSLATVYCVQAGGSGSTPSTNADTACTTPYPAFNNLPTLSVPYIVLFRNGTYTATINGPPSGTAAQSNFIMAYPGEQPFMDMSGGSLIAFSTVNKAYITVDGFKIKASASNAGYATGTFVVYPGTGPIVNFWNALYRCEIFNGGGDSNVDGNNMIRMDAEQLVLHDPFTGGGQHNFYMGANTVPSSGIAIRRSIMYNVATGGFPNLQLNGRCTQCYVEQNVIYNSDGQAFTLFNGVTNSFVRNNLIFNTGTHTSGSARSMTIADYDSAQCRVNSAPSICAYDQTGNVIANNTFWVGTLGFDGSGTINPSYAIRVSNTTTSSTTCPSGSTGPCGNLGGNFFYNNIIVALSSNGNADAPVLYDAANPANYLASDTWHNNIIQNSAGFSTIVASEGGTGLTCTTFNSGALSGSNCSTSNPLFINSSTSNATTPTNFNFKLQASSPAIGSGTAVWFPALDNAGTVSAATPFLGTFTPTVNPPTITITSPTANQIVAGFTGFNFTATIANAPSAYCMAWQVDAYLPVGSSCVKAPFTLFHNTFMELNGTHTVTAILKDALGNTITTATQTFSIANTWPIAAGIGMTVATGTPLASLWSGTVSVTPTITGPDATHSKDTTWFVDGNLIFTDTLDTAASPTLSIDTTQFTNGQHVVAVVVKDNFGGISYGSDNFYVGSALEWSQPVTFANAAATMELRTNMREVFLPPSGTFQLTATLYGADGSALSTPTPVYFSLNPSAVTVTSGGLLTGLTPVANTPSMARIGVMSPTVSGTDLVCLNQTNCNSGYKSASNLMTQQNVGQMIVIPSGAGTWVAGNYYIQTVQNNGSGAFFLMSCTNSVCTTANPGANNSVPTSFTTGPTETVYAMVTTSAPNPPIYHFDCTNGAILSTYTAGHSCYWISGFQTTQGFPYTATGTPGLDQTYSPGFVTDYANGGFTSVEASPSLQPSASTTESAYSGGGGTLPTAVANYQAAVSGTNLHFTLIGDNWLKNSGPAAWGNGGLAQTTRAIYSPAWTTTPWTHVLNAWNGKAFTVEGGDEYSNFGPNPFEGPVTFTNGITSIVATGGGGAGESCQVNGNFSLSTLRHFVISGSVTTNMNSATGTFYTASAQSPTFTFTCANVADGTYNSSNDSGLSIEPYVSSWFNNLTGLSTSANDYLRYDMFTNIRSQFTAATSGRANLTFSQIGTAGCSYIYGFTNPAAGLADYSTHLYTGFNQGYIMSRNQVRGVVGTNGDLPIAPANGIMNPARLGFGCYSASAPLINQNSTVTNDYGLQGYTPNGSGTATGPNQDGTNPAVTNVTSFSGNTLTLNTDHLIRQIYPGITRIQLSAMSNSADNGNYYVIGWPDTTHLTLANATSDFLANTTTLTATMLIGDTTFTVASAAMFDTAPYIAYIGGELISCTTLTTNTFSVCTRGVSGGTGAAQHNSGTAVQIGGGTIHFQNGDTKSLYNIAATQTNTCGNAGQGPGNVCGDTFAYTGSTDQTILRHRGMTFTISGTSNSHFNNGNFYYNAENSGPVTAAFGNHYRELPNGSSTSGTATIIAAQDYVPGRQGGTPYFFDPDVAFAGQIAGFYVRGSGTRDYTIAFNQNGYAANGGILNGGFPQQPSYFNYVCIDPGCVSAPGTGIQGYSHPHWRSLYQAENFHAVALANLLHQRLASYWLTTSLNSPDMGNNFECTARSGSKGKSVGCMNTTNAPQSISFITTPYLQSGQNFGQFIANSQAILFSTVAAGTSPAVATVPAGGEVVWVFPATFAGEFSQPTISVQSSDVTNATSVIVEYGYDQFLLDIGASTVSCSTGPSCTIPVDRNIGPVYYRLIYMNSSNAVISIGDVQIL